MPPGKFEPGLESMQSFLPSALTWRGMPPPWLEVDIETCGIRILRYVVVNDSGRVINPMMVEGQLTGGAAHGIGNALFEWMGYDDQAQPMPPHSPTISCRARPSAQNRGEVGRPPSAQIRSA